MYIKLLCPYFKFVKSPPELTYILKIFVFAYANVIYKLVKYMHHALIRHVYQNIFSQKSIGTLTNFMNLYYMIEKIHVH